MSVSRIFLFEGSKIWIVWTLLSFSKGCSDDSESFLFVLRLVPVTSSVSILMFLASLTKELPATLFLSRASMLVRSIDLVYWLS